MKITRLILALILLPLLWALPAGGAQFEHPIMRPDAATLARWLAQERQAPRAPLDQAIALQLRSGMEVKSSHSLLSYIQYTPSERNQLYCGNCWVWAGTGILEVALDVQRGIKERLSTQYLNSCYSDRYACQGGNLNRFADFYSSVGRAIPWSNSGAAFQDGDRSCASASSSCVACSSIATSPNYPISSIVAQTIETQGVGKDKAIENIKNVLLQNKAVWFAFRLPDGSSWSAFQSYWNNDSESTVCSLFDGMNGKAWEDGAGGHAVLLVGYDDSDHTWIILNSWGTGSSGNRPNGLFKMSQDMDYDCYYTHPTVGKVPAFSFQTLAVTFSDDGSSPGGIAGFGVWANNIYCTNGQTFYFAGSLDSWQTYLSSYTLYGWLSSWDGWYSTPSGVKTIDYAYGCGDYTTYGRGSATLEAGYCYTLLPYLDYEGNLQVGLYLAGSCSSSSGQGPLGPDKLGSEPGEAPYGVVPLQ